MKKTMKISCIISLIAIMIPFISLAQGWDILALKADATKAGVTTARSFVDIAGAAGRWIMSVIGAVSVVMFIVAGAMYTTAAGNEEQVGKAKKIITYAVIGLVVALSGFLILEVVRAIAGQADLT